MFSRGLWIDDNWIADGYFFRKVERVVKKSFMDNFRQKEGGATVILKVVSSKFLFGSTNAPSVLLGGGGFHYPVQTRLLEAVGVDLDEPELWTFRLNPETKYIYVYDEDGLIGGCMPLVVD